MKKHTPLSRSPAKVTQLDEHAGAFLDLLLDLGHLDDQLLVEVNDRLLDLDKANSVLAYEDVRRVVAQVIFERSPELDPEYQRVIDAEWGFLFH